MVPVDVVVVVAIVVAVVVVVITSECLHAEKIVLFATQASKVAVVECDEAFW